MPDQYDDELEDVEYDEEYNEEYNEEYEPLIDDDEDFGWFGDILDEDEEEY